MRTTRLLVTEVSAGSSTYLIVNGTAFIAETYDYSTNYIFGEEFVDYYIENVAQPTKLKNVPTVPAEKLKTQWMELTYNEPLKHGWLEQIVAELYWYDHTNYRTEEQLSLRTL